MRQGVRALVKKIVRIGLSVIISLSFFLYVTFKIDWRLFATQLRDINYGFLLAGVASYFLNYVLRAFRLKILVSSADIPFRDLLSINFLHNFYNRILPARLGDFSLIYLLNQFTREKVNAGVRIFLFVKFYDLLMALVLLAFSYTMIYGLDYIGTGIWLVSIFVLLPCIFPSFVLQIPIRLIARFEKWKFLKKIRSELVQWLAETKKLETIRIRACLLGSSFGIWALIVVLFYLLMLSIGGTYGIKDTLFATTLANFSWVLPINGVGGFGTMEISMAYAFSLRGHEFGQVLLSALYINVVVFMTTILFAIVPYIKLLGKGRSRNETHHPNSVSE